MSEGCHMLLENSECLLNGFRRGDSDGQGRLGLELHHMQAMIASLDFKENEKPTKRY